MQKICLILFIIGCSSALSLSPLPLGVVEGIHDCGSQGVVHETRVTDCDKIPCHFKPNIPYLFEVEFTTSDSSEVLHLVVHVYIGNDEFKIIDEAVITDTEGNQRYLLSYTILLPTDAEEGLLNVSAEVVDKMAERLEVCSLASVIFEKDFVYIPY